MSQSPGIWKELSAMLLVSGTCIGGGMLALPVASASVGYLPSLLTMLVTYLIMTLSGLLYFEVTLWFRPGAHLITMSSRLLGKPGKIICWITFLFISYGSLIGYSAAGGRLIESVLGWEQPSLWESLGFAALFALPLLLCIVLGKRLAGSVNSLLFAAMVAFYVLLIGVGSSTIDGSLLTFGSWRAGGIIALMPVMLTMFSIPGIVPTLVPYLDRNVTSMRRVIIGGLGLTLLFYLLWQTVIMGTVPIHGPNSLTEAYATGELASCAFRCHLSSPLLSLLSDGFAAFALATSFLGISLALFDFLADGFSWKTTTARKWLLAVIIFVPLAPLSVFIERAFVLMMELTGGVGDAIISILLPASMVYVGRYLKPRQSAYATPGGKPLLVLLSFAGLLVMSYELLRLFRP